MINTNRVEEKGEKKKKGEKRSEESRRGNLEKIGKNND